MTDKIKLGKLTGLEKLAGIGTRFLCLRIENNLNEAKTKMENTLKEKEDIYKEKNIYLASAKNHLDLAKADCTTLEECGVNVKGYDTRIREMKKMYIQLNKEENKK